jgi:hypothetical protein
MAHFTQNIEQQVVNLSFWQMMNIKSVDWLNLVVWFLGYLPIKKSKAKYIFLPTNVAVPLFLIVQKLKIIINNKLKLNTIEYLVSYIK